VVFPSGHKHLKAYADNPELPEDVNGDGVVDILDVALVAEAFASYPGHERWNPETDIDANDKVNILDATMVCLKFGVRTGSLFGDLNGDGKVDIKDLVIVATAFGSFPGHPRWNSEADVNQDNYVDMQDLTLVASHFGETFL
jgi:hypothetical protein